MKKLSQLVFLLCCILFGGCVNVPMESHSSDAAAKKFETELLKAHIYIIQPWQWWSNVPYTTEVLIDGRVVGFLAPHSFVMLSVLPGEHTVATRIQGDAGQESIQVVWGTNYFFEFKPAPFRYKLVAVPEEQGRKDVMKAKRARARMYE